MYSQFIRPFLFFRTLCGVCVYQVIRLPPFKQSVFHHFSHQPFPSLANMVIIEKLRAELEL